jgi:hypothetical protein
MQSYAVNSPQAVARLVAAAIVTDTEIDEREIAVLDRLDAYERIGLTRSAFMRVARDYCADLGRMAERSGTFELLDRDWLDTLCGSITDPRLRLLVCRLIVAILPADGAVQPGEVALLQHLVQRWRLLREAVAEAVDADVQMLRAVA